MGIEMTGWSLERVLIVVILVVLVVWLIEKVL